MSERYPGKRPSCSHKGPCPKPDECARCRDPIHAHDLIWLVMVTDEGLVACGNYCSPSCEQETADPEVARDVAEELRWRQLRMSGAEP